MWSRTTCCLPLPLIPATASQESRSLQRNKLISIPVMFTSWHRKFTCGNATVTAFLDRVAPTSEIPASSGRPEHQNLEARADQRIYRPTDRAGDEILPQMPRRDGQFGINAVSIDMPCALTDRRRSLSAAFPAAAQTVDRKLSRRRRPGNHAVAEPVSVMKPARPRSRHGYASKQASTAVGRFADDGTSACPPRLPAKAGADGPILAAPTNLPTGPPVPTDGPAPRPAVALGTRFAEPAVVPPGPKVSHVRSR